MVLVTALGDALAAWLCRLSARWRWSVLLRRWTEWRALGLVLAGRGGLRLRRPRDC